MKKSQHQEVLDFIGNFRLNQAEGQQNIPSQAEEAADTE